MISEASTQIRKILASKWSKRDDRSGSVLPQQPAAAGSSVHLPEIHEQIRRGSLRGAEEPVIVNTKDLEVDDIVIAVMGPTGSGKSTFVCAASGLDPKEVASHGLRSFTDKVTAIKYWDQESMRHVVLVDTPGFDDTSKSDLDILSLISEWLVSSYNKRKLLSGLLYLHRITDNRVAGSSLKNLRVFRKLCGKDALDKVYLTTTMWDEVDPSVGEKRLEELIEEFWKTMITQGAQVARCRSDDDSPKKLVRQIVECGTPPLQPPPVEIGQLSSYSQEKPQRYDISRRGTPTPQLQVENRQGPYSHSQEKPQRYAHGGAPPPVENKLEPSSYLQEKPLKNDAGYGGTPVPQHPLVENRQGPSSHSQGEQQRYDVLHAGTPTPQPPSVDYKHGPSSHPQQRPQRYDVARGGIPTSQLPVESRQGPSAQSQNVGKLTRIGREPTQTVRQGSFQAAEEPEVNTRGQGADDVLAIAMGLRDGKGTEPHGKALLIQDEIAELKKELKETAAGQQLYSQLETLVEKQLELLRRIEKERKAASDPEIVQELQTEYRDLRAQIDEKLRQMQQLKLPWLKRFFTRRRD